MQLYLGEQAMTCHLFDHWSLAKTITITVTEKTDIRYNVCHNSDIYLHHYIIVEIIFFAGSPLFTLEKWVALLL